MSAVMDRSPRVSRAERVAANRASIEQLLATRGVVTLATLRLPVPVRDPGPRPLRYVEVGQCRTCKFTWRTASSGVLKLHGPVKRRCKGSYELPLWRTVVLKSRYVPGERWPKGRT